MKFRVKKMEHSNKASTQEQEDSLTQSVRVFPESSHTWTKWEMILLSVLGLFK